MSEMTPPIKAPDNLRWIGASPDRRRYAADLRRIADLLEQGEVESMCAAFSTPSDASWTSLLWVDPKADLVRLVGASTLLHSMVLHEAEQDFADEAL